VTCGPTLRARTSYFTCCTHRALAYQPHKQEFCHRRGVVFQLTRGNIGMACAQAVALRRHVASPRRPPPLHMAHWTNQPKPNRRRGAPTTVRLHVASPRRPQPLHMAHLTNQPKPQPSGGLSSDGWA
jgi:hypothetical protein